MSISIHTPQRGATSLIDLREGDCLEVMKDIPDKSIDMILCDLPYGTLSKPLIL